MSPESYTLVTIGKQYFAHNLSQPGDRCVFNDGSSMRSGNFIDPKTVTQRLRRCAGRA